MKKNNQYRYGKRKIILTGDRPTGRLHIGHYVGSLRRRVELQNSGLYDKTFVFIADAQALTDNMETRKGTSERYRSSSRLSGLRIGSYEEYHLYPVTDSGIVRTDILLYGPCHRIAPAT